MGTRAREGTVNSLGRRGGIVTDIVVRNAGAHLAHLPSYCLHNVDFSRYFYDFGAVQHDPEKWTPVFGKDHAETRVNREAR